ncbi:MAG: hypothetical protein KKA46_15035 [Proteobacteria bacterium]|nr:hypothetical protein [Pseudomonadota bacterium]
MDETIEPDNLEEISLELAEDGGVLHELAALNHNGKCRQATLEGFIEAGAG